MKKLLFCATILLLVGCTTEKQKELDLIEIQIARLRYHKELVNTRDDYALGLEIKRLDSLINQSAHVILEQDKKFKKDE